MKKRFISFVTVLTMLASMLSFAPSMVFAADEPLPVTMTQNQNSGDGVMLRKTAQAQSDGTVDIIIDAYTTGTVTTQSMATPSDIVLVLDVSGSMNNNMTQYTYAYTPALGSEYTTGFIFTSTYYGFPTGTTYYIKSPIDATKYIAVSRVGDDANDYIYYSYVDNLGTTKYIYPELNDASLTNRANEYPVEQFYTRAVSSQETVNKMVALKASVDDFIDQTLDMNNAVADDSKKHRIAVVKYADDSYYSASGAIVDINGAANATVGNNKDDNEYNYTQLVHDFAVVDAAGDASLKAAVDSLTTGGATAIDYGLQMAQATLNKRSSAEMTARNEVVILFSDGSPTHSSGFEENVANAALERALALKNAGAQIYSLSVFEGANDTVVGNDNTNKFMHYVSSNFPNAQSMTNPGSGDTAKGYYMTPDHEMNLTRIFEQIIANIGSPKISLGENTAVVDTLSQYFDLENDVNPASSNIDIAIIEKTADSAGGNVAYDFVPNPENFEISVSVGTNNRQILVDGFKFDENYVSPTGRENNFAGRILRITIHTKPNYEAIDNLKSTTGIINTNLISDPAKIVDPAVAEPIATTASPEVKLRKVSYKVDGDSFAEGMYDVWRLYGSDYDVIFNPTKEGHTFSGWDKTGTFTMPDNDVEINGAFNINNYNVSYSYTSAGTPIPSGVGPVPSDASYAYNAAVSVEPYPSAPAGYTFSGWKSGEVTPADGSFNMPARDVKFVGYFIPNGDTQYKVVHYGENLDGTAYEVLEQYTDAGVTDTIVSVSQKHYTGFEFDLAATQSDGSQQDGVTVEANGIVKGKILGDGTRVFNLYYSRNSYDVEYHYEGTVPSDASPQTPPAKVSYKYGAEVWVESSAEAPAGYEFHGWISEDVSATSGQSFTMPAKNLLFEGHFVAQGGIPYKVEHYLQNLDRNGYVLHQTKNYTGQTDAEVSTIPQYFEGFTYDLAATSDGNSTNPDIIAVSSENVTGKINGNGLTVLKLYYSRNKHYVHYEYTGELPENRTSLPPIAEGYFGETIYVAPDANAPGYDFVGWHSVGASGVIDSDTSFVMPDADVHLRGMFTPRNDVQYKVEHWVQKKDNASEYERYKTTTHYDGVAGQQVTALRIRIVDNETGVELGYTFDENNVNNIKSGIVKGDGSTVLKLYYNRDPQFEVKYEFTGKVPAGATLPTPNPVTGFIQGEVINVAVITPPAGYTFSGWTSYGGAVQPDDTSFIMPARNVNLSGYFIPDETTYTVKHWLQNENRIGYTASAENTETINAKVGDEVVAYPKTFEGFTYTTALGEYEGVVLPNGSLVINLYYTRNPHTVSYSYYGPRTEGAPDLSINDYAPKNEYYGDTVDIAAKPELNGYIFDGWYSAQVSIATSDGDFVMPNQDVVLVGRFLPADNTPYKIEHYTQVSDDAYTLHSSEDKTGTTTTLVSAEPKTISGYTYNSNHPNGLASGIITAYNSVTGEGNMLVLRMYYTKNSSGGGGGGGGSRTYTLIYESNGGTEYENEKYSSGKLVQLDKVPEKEGYIFDGWHLDKELTDDATEVKMTSSKTVYANWIEDNGAAGNGHATPDSLNGDDHFAYVIGYPDETVRPNNNITRAEVTSIFFRLLTDAIREENLAEENSFFDITSDMWYNTAISTMEKLGIVNGRYEGVFAADEFITRAEFAAICARFDDSEFTVVDDFNDVDGHWAADYIHEAAAHGWIRGYEDGSFKPDQNITRAEAMTMINRVLNRVPENVDALLDDMIKWSDNSDEAQWYYLPVQEATNSHEFEKINNIYEKWSKLLEGTDWTIYE